MSGTTNEEGKRPTTAAENFGDSPFSDLDSISLPEAALGSFPEKTGKPRKPKVEKADERGERLEVRREKAVEGEKVTTTASGFPPRI